VRPGDAALMKRSQFCDVFAPKACGFSSSSGGNFPYNNGFLIHNFSFRTRAVQEEGGLYKLSEGVSLSTPSF